MQIKCVFRISRVIVGSAVGRNERLQRIQYAQMITNSAPCNKQSSQTVATKEISNRECTAAARKKTDLALVPRRDTDTEEATLDRTRGEMVDNAVIRFRQNRIVVSTSLRHVSGMIERPFLELGRKRRWRYSTTQRGGRELIRRRRRIRRFEGDFVILPLRFPLAPRDEIRRNLLRPFRFFCFP